MTLLEELGNAYGQWKDISMWALLHTSNESRRSAAEYERVVQQFDVEHSARYRPRDGLTFCNIFVSDVTRAMCCHIPHWVTANNVAAKPGDRGARELNANATLVLLSADALPGWIKATPDEAMRYARSGHPAVIGWRNGGGGPGHIAMVMPGEALFIAQAGSVCSPMMLHTKGFGLKAPLQFFVHA